MRNLESIDAKVKELNQLIEQSDELAHKALDARNYDAMHGFVNESDMFRAKRDALLWVCGEIDAL